jgi:hypothetical protein
MNACALRQSLAGAAILGSVIGYDPSAHAQDIPLPTNVYVFTHVENDRAATSIEEARVKLVDALKQALPNNKRISDQVAVADQREDATIAVEITLAQYQGRVTPTTNRVVVIETPNYLATVQLSFGTYKTDFTVHESERPFERTVNSGRFDTPKTIDATYADLLRVKAASDLATQIRQWITDNKADLQRKP